MKLALPLTLLALTGSAALITQPGQLPFLSKRQKIGPCEPYRAEGCRHCTDCSACKHCSQNGGKCTVCLQQGK